MSANSKQPNWKSWLQPGSANATFAGLAIVAVLFVGVAAYWLKYQPESRVSLLAGAKLLEHDLGRMQLAFGNAGLNDFEVRDGQVFVPKSQRDRFLKALNDHNGIPETSREMYEPDSLNPWATSQQVQESTLLRKKKMIRQLVLQLDFVADAVVDYDELSVASWPPSTRRSAAIVIHPKDDRLLESHQVDAIRHTICGAVAGLAPTDIVITDIAAGHAYVANGVESPASSVHGLDWLERAKTEQRIRDAMSQFGEGIEVQVMLQECDGGDVETDPPTAPVVQTGNAQAPIANQPASIATRDESLNSKSEKMGQENPSAPNPTIHVKIRAPEKCIREFAGLVSIDSQDGQSLEKQLQLFRSQVRDAVKPLLAVDWASGKRQQIDVSMILGPARTDESSAVPQSISTWTKFTAAAGLVLGVVTFFSLALAVRMAFRRDGHTHEREPMATRTHRQSLPNGPPADLFSDETKRKLRQIVDDDPDQAAEIIKQWIRGAA